MPTTYGKRPYWLLPLLLCIWWMPTHYIFGASFVLSPSSGTYVVGDTITLDVLVTTDTPSNAVSGTMKLPASLEAASVTKGNVVDLWLTEPAVVQGGRVMIFEGVAVDSDGFSGTGKVLTLNLRVVAPTNSTVSFSEGLILANDGFGTNIADSFDSASFELLPAQETQPEATPLAEAPTASSLLAGNPTDRLFAPIVMSHPQRLTSIDEFRIEGVTYPDARVLVYLQTGTDETPKEYETVSDAGGNFAFAYAQTDGLPRQLLPANVLNAAASLFAKAEPLRFWLRTEKDGIQSPPTKAFEVPVGGFGLDTIFSISTSILLMTLIIIALLFALGLAIIHSIRFWKYFRRRLRF